MQDFARLDVEKKGRVIVGGVGGRCLGTVALTCATFVPLLLLPQCRNADSAGFVEVAELKRVMGGNDVVTDALIGEYDASGDGATCCFALNHLERSLILSGCV